jgi:sulfopyruvate decarboxylase subunit beta
MLDKYACLKKIHARRRDELVVTSMSVAMPWAALSDGPLDFASVESAMGHTADFAHGLALAQPQRRVIVFNGDGSTLMCLGSLVTMAQYPAENFTMVLTENGTYEVTGNQPVPGAAFIDYAAIARGAGIKEVHELSTEAEFDAKLDLHFDGKGPLVIIWKIEQASEPVPKPALPIRQRAQRLRQALAD